MGILLTLLLWMSSASVWASHDWIGLDLCRSYPERMPPQLDPGLLPDPQGRGVQLLGRYCGQCHYAPGPGQHSAAEWTEVVRRMGLLMEVTARFAAQLRPVAMPTSEERAELLGYLQAQALRPLNRPETAPPAYRTLCGDCHAAPDPAAYPDTDWPALLARMQDHRRSMARPPTDRVTEAQVRSYLGVAKTVAGEPPVAGSVRNDHLGRWLALGPVFLLLLLGLVRWWWPRRSGA